MLSKRNKSRKDETDRNRGRRVIKRWRVRRSRPVWDRSVLSPTSNRLLIQMSEQLDIRPVCASRSDSSSLLLHPPLPLPHLHPYLLMVRWFFLFVCFCPNHTPCNCLLKLRCSSSCVHGQWRGTIMSWVDWWVRQWGGRDKDGRTGTGGRRTHWWRTAVVSRHGCDSAYD